jgi:hypothetical protein
LLWRRRNNDKAKEIDERMVLGKNLEVRESVANDAVRSWASKRIE